MAVAADVDAGFERAAILAGPTSLIINAWGRKNGTSFDYATGSALDTSGTGNGATADVTKDWYSV